jgi:hypothetical protein
MEPIKPAPPVINIFFIFYFFIFYLKNKECLEGTKLVGLWSYLFYIKKKTWFIVSLLILIKT